MVGFAHVVLHLTLCNALANLPSSANVAVHLHMGDSTGRQRADQNFSGPRGESLTRTIEFDAPRGTFRVILTTPGHPCAAIDFWSIMSQAPRTIAETMVAGRPTEPHPLLVEGTAPESFLYAAPQFVLFPKNTECNKPVGDPLPSNFTVENDGSSFYLWMYSNPALDATGALVALQVGTPTGEYHYIRVKMRFPEPWHGFPTTWQFNVSSDAIEWLAQQPVDELLCPRMFTTSVAN